MKKISLFSLALAALMAQPAASAFAPVHAQPRAGAPALLAQGADGASGGADASGPVLDAVPAAPQATAPHPDPIPGLAGPYLAARAAAMTSDFRAAADYYTAALKAEPGDPVLQDSALVALISAGRTSDAVHLATQLKAESEPTELAGLILRADMARNARWPDLVAALKSQPTAAAEQGGALLDGMVRAWALMGEGKATEALAAFDKLSRMKGAAGMTRYHLALANASVGNFEAAAKALADPESSGHLLGLIARIQVLSQLDRDDEAKKLLDDLGGFENEPQLVELYQRLERGEKIPFTAVRTPADGIAQVFLTFASALAGGSEPDPLALIHGRVAEYLAPDLGEARLMVAQILQDAGQFDLAAEEFDSLRQMGDIRPAAELGRIEALSRAQRLPDAEKAARALVEAQPGLPQAWIALGDLLRQRDRWADAIPAYDKAIEILRKRPEPQALWFPLYARGIAEERSGQYEKADADMQEALTLQPEQAPILNYLGYSWVDRNIRLEEGLKLIEKAVALKPDDAYIQDSLAWAFYRMGRYDDAVAPMEKAVTMMSDDSLVNDHMGDIYWMVGRKREAEIQWRRALSLWKETDADTNRDRIRAKLNLGLDAVLAAEKANGGKFPPGFGQPEPVPVPSDTAANDASAGAGTGDAGEAPPPGVGDGAAPEAPANPAQTPKP